MAGPVPRRCRTVGTSRRAARGGHILRRCSACARSAPPYLTVSVSVQIHTCSFSKRKFRVGDWGSRYRNVKNRPSVLDERTKIQRSSSLYLAPTNRLQGKGGLPFGCHLFLPGPPGDELARLVFSGTRSPLFPNSDELVAFWYDGRVWDYDDVDLASTPIVEPIRA